MYIGNVLLAYRTKCTLSRTKIHACPTYFARVFWSDLECILSDMQVGHFQCTYRTNYGLNKLKKHGSQNE